MFAEGAWVQVHHAIVALEVLPQDSLDLKQPTPRGADEASPQERPSLAVSQRQKQDVDSISGACQESELNHRQGT